RIARIRDGATWPPRASRPTEWVRAAESGTSSPSLGCNSLRPSAEIGLFVFLRDKSTRALLHVAFHKKGRSAIRKLYIWHLGLTVQRCPGTRRFWADGPPTGNWPITSVWPVAREQSDCSLAKTNSIIQCPIAPQPDWN